MLRKSKNEQNRASVLQSLCFGTSGQRNIYPLNTPKNRLGNQITPCRGQPGLVYKQTRVILLFLVSAKFQNSRIRPWPWLSRTKCGRRLSDIENIFQKGLFLWCQDWVAISSSTTKHSRSHSGRSSLPNTCDCAKDLQTVGSTLQYFW